MEKNILKFRIGFIQDQIHPQIVGYSTYIILRR